MTHFQRRKLIELFHRIDTTRDGSLELSDFSRQVERVRQAAGWSERHPTYQRLLATRRKVWNEIQRRMDADADGEVSLDEWMEVFSTAEHHARQTGRPPEWLGQISEAFFDSMDLDGDGRVGKDEYRYYLLSVGVAEDAGKRFAEVADGQRFLSLGHFDRCFAQWLLSRDPAEPGNYFLTGALTDTAEDGGGDA